jgi:hypothetical protein
MIDKDFLKWWEDNRPGIITGVCNPGLSSVLSAKAFFEDCWISSKIDSQRKEED